MGENQEAPSSIRVVSEVESDAPGNESEPEDTQVNESMSTGTKKRKRDAYNSVEQKGRAPKKQTSGNEASTSRQPPKQKETKDAGNRVKNTLSKFARRKKEDKMTDMEVLFWKNRVAFPVSFQTPASFDQIRKDWPMRPDLQKILKMMDDNSNNETLDDVNRELDSLGKKRKEQEKDLDDVLGTNMANGNQEERCSGYFSWLIPQDQVQDQVEYQVEDEDQDEDEDEDEYEDQVQVQDQDQYQVLVQDQVQVQVHVQDQDQDQYQVLVQDQVQVQVQVQDQDQDQYQVLVQDQVQVQENFFTPEGTQFWYLGNQFYVEDNNSLSTKEVIRVLVTSLENQLYDNNNNKVSFKDFEGLAEALEKTSGLAPLPDKLKPVAAQIKEDRGEDTGINHLSIEVIVCAAIKEMKCSPAESVNWNMLKKWGATLSYAKQNGFQVSYADLLLKKNLKSYALEILSTNGEFPSIGWSVGRLLTHEEIRSSVTCLTNLESQLYDNNNNKVSFEDFEGLAEALLKTSGSAPLPDNLKSIAAQIKEAHGEDTGINHLSIEVIVCAAIKEMECLPCESVNWDMLKKWGATLNYAKQNGFQVSFADASLKRNLKSYVLDNFY